MPRKNTSEEVFTRVDEAGLILDLVAGGSSTLSAATAVGATVVNVVSATGIVANDLLRIGSGNVLEENIVLSVAVNAVTLKMPLTYAHAIGEAVVERQKVKHGEVTDQGLKVNTSINEGVIKTATTSGVYLKTVTDVDHTFTWMTINHALENVAASYGMADAAITGAGTSASPRRLVVTTRNIRSVQNVSAYFIGTTADARIFEVQGWAMDLGQSGDRTYNTGPGVPTALGGSCRALAHLDYA